MPRLEVRVGDADFDVGALQRSLLGADTAEGAVATFTGYVRGAGEESGLRRMTLEHYPDMTEKSILAILEEAAGRWPVLAATVVHRVGELAPGEQIVRVGVASAHRAAAFEACKFVMDYLKTQAPFWKKEDVGGRARWVESRDSDDDRAGRW